MTSVCLFFFIPFFFFFLFQGTTNGLSNRVRTWMTRTDDKPTRRYPALGKRLFMIRHHRCGQNSRRIGFTVGNSVRSPRRVSNRQSGPRDYCSYFPWTIVLFFSFSISITPTLTPFLFLFLFLEFLFLWTSRSIDASRTSSKRYVSFITCEGRY